MAGAAPPRSYWFASYSKSSPKRADRESERGFILNRNVCTEKLSPRHAAVGWRPNPTGASGPCSPYWMDQSVSLPMEIESACHVTPPSVVLRPSEEAPW